MAKNQRANHSKQIPQYRLLHSLLLVPENKNIYTYKQYNVSGIIYSFVRLLARYKLFLLTYLLTYLQLIFGHQVC